MMADVTARRSLSNFSEALSSIGGFRMRRGTKAGVITILISGCLLWILASTPRASAIPAFSRKYQTSCATCHSNYPELNDFGEAFKRNGFKFPKDDESFVKEPPVLLGAKAQKEAFPNAIYPGEIPGTIPISFRYSGNFNYASKRPAAVAATSFTPRTDLFSPNTLTIIAAGSFGQNISFWIDNDISTAGSGAGGGLGDGYLKFDVGHYIGLPSRAFNVRFGQFELDLPFSQARTIYPSSYDIFSETAPPPPTTAGQTVFQTVNNPFFLGTPQRGIEIGGYANSGNFTWSVALDDGTNSSYGLSSGVSAVPSLSVRNTKDVYVRVSQRFNLEHDPQSRNAVQAAGPTGPHDHTSIRLGGFYYHGTNESNVGSSTYSFTGTIQDPFYRAGGDVRFKYRKMELFGVGMVGHDINHAVDTNPIAPTVTLGPAVNYAGGFAGGNFWIYPWMIGYIRYDFVNSASDFANNVSQYRTRNRFSPGFQLLVRANVKLIGEYQYHWGVPYTDPAPPNNTLYFRPNSFVTGIDYVF
jgi:hypothetical protein